MEQNINVIIGEGEHPMAVVQVPPELENMVRHGLQRLNVRPGDINVERILETDHLPSLKFTCCTFPKDRLDEFYWHMGEWYVRYHPLISKQLN